MSLKLQLETAKNDVSKALITALENKDIVGQPKIVSELFSVYEKISSITADLRFETSFMSQYNPSVYTVPSTYTPDIYNQPFSSASKDIISF